MKGRDITHDFMRKGVYSALGFATPVLTEYNTL